MKFHSTDIKVCVWYVRGATSIIIGCIFFTVTINSHQDDFQHHFLNTYVQFQENICLCSATNGNS